ncbi:MAG: glycosyltransferase, partial [Caulobacterales bacterium]|nr:glycosyltransferase [Caulobacterales bacterium]
MVIESLAEGSGRHVVDLATGLGARGHRVTVAYSSLRADQRFIDRLEAAENVRLASFRMKRSVHPSDAAAIASLWRLIRRHGPFDIVHGHSSKGGAAARLAPAGRARRVYTPHAFRTLDPAASWASTTFYGAIERTLAAFASDVVVCVSDDELAHARDVLKIAPGKLTKCANGIRPPKSA